MGMYNLKRNLARFTNGKALTFMQLVQREAESSSDKSMADIFANFKNAVSEFADATKLVNTTSRTKNVNSIFGLLTKRYSFLKQMSKNAVFMQDLDSKAVADEVYFLLSQVGKFNSQGYFDRLAKYKVTVSSIREKVDAEKLVSAGFDSVLSDIEALIEQFESVYDERNAYRKESKRRVKETRKAAEQAYSAFALFAACKANLGEKKFQVLVDHVNEAIHWNDIHSSDTVNEKEKNS